MTADTPTAFLKSLGFHALVIVILLLFAYTVSSGVKDVPQVFELVVGDGNNYAATVAPALGMPEGAKITVPVPPAPKREPQPVEPRPVEPEPAPIKPAPAPVPEKAAPPVAVTPPKKAAPDFSKQVRKAVIIADSRTKQQLAREHAAEEKRAREEAALRAKQAKQAPKFTPIDSEGIRKGITGGSTENKTGGARGTALTAEEGTARQRYEAMLKRRLQEALERPAGLSDTLVTKVEFHISASGTLFGVRIQKTSGSAEFDRAVLEAFARVGSVGPRPKGEDEVLSLDFAMKEIDGG